MEETANFEKCLALIQGVQLPHPDGELLTCFLYNSIDQDRAARYFLDVCKVGKDGATELSDVLARWKSLGEICEFYTSSSPSLHKLCQVNPNIGIVVRSPPPPRPRDKHIIRDITTRDGVCYLTARQGLWLDPLVVTYIFPLLTKNIDTVSPSLLSDIHLFIVTLQQGTNHMLALGIQGYVDSVSLFIT